MDLETIFEHGGLSLAIILTIIQIAPININPWSAIGRLIKALFGFVGHALNGDLLSELSQIKHVQNEQSSKLEAERGELREQLEVTRGELKDNLEVTREELKDKLEATRKELKGQLDETTEQLDQHIKTDAERYANRQRAHILRFGNELGRQIPHSQEDFEEILKDVDWYERYCKNHAGYEISRCSIAIETIKSAYLTHLKNHDFFREESHNGT